LLIMGDFNYPTIDYVREVVAAGDAAPESQFFYKTQELCIYQHVKEATRYRNGQVPSTLNYVFTEDEDIIDAINYTAPLGRSDHVVLEWELQLEAKELVSRLKKLNYFKGNYVEIGAAIMRVDWAWQFGDGTVNEMWECFKEVLLDLVHKYVPLKEDKRKKEGRWLSKETIKRMKERKKAWTKYQQFKSGRNYEEYKKVRNEVNSMIRNDEDQNRKRILQGFKGKPKKFYGYMRSLQTVKDNVLALTNDTGQLTETDQEAADLLANYFKESYTREDLMNMPRVTPSNLSLAERLSERNWRNYGATNHRELTTSIQWC